MVRIGDKPWLDDWCVLAHRAKQRACRVWSRSRTRDDWEKYRVPCRHSHRVYMETKRAFNERGRTLLTNAPIPRKWWSTVETAVLVRGLACHLW